MCVILLDSFPDGPQSRVLIKLNTTELRDDLMGVFYIQGNSKTLMSDMLIWVFLSLNHAERLSYHSQLGNTSKHFTASVLLSRYLI